jgi:hypothetical protein
MSPTIHRRRFLAATAAGTASAVAGCSSISLTGSSTGDSPARDWVYGPDEYVTSDDFQLAVRFRSPKRLAGVEDDLNDEVAARARPIRTDGLDPEDVDWSVQVGEELFNGPFVQAHGGSFDVEDAREGAASGANLPDADGTEVATVGDLVVVEYEPERYGAFGDGEAVTVHGAADLDVEAFVADGADDAAGIVDAADGFAGLLDAIRFDHTASVTFGTGDDGPFGSGFGYTVDGDRTEVRWAAYQRYDAAEMEAVAGGVDALDDVSVDTDGDRVVLSATAASDRLALDGTVFSLLEAPYE